jgi:hypothetical protein
MSVTIGLLCAPAAVRGQPAPQPLPDTPSGENTPAPQPPPAEPQPPPAAEDAPAPEPQLSAEELAEIEAALGQDAAAQAAARPEPASTGKPGLLGALQSMNPDISFIADVALAWLSSEDNLQTGGHDPARNGFTLQQLEMSIGSAVDPYFRVDGNIVFSQFGVEIEEIYATTLALPWSLQARAGQFLTRFGRINATHPHTWDFVDQAFAIGRYFGAEGNRGLGVELSYLTPLPWYVEIVGSVTEAGGAATARSFFGAAPLSVASVLDFQSTLAVKQFFALGPDWSLLWGMSAATGPNGTGHDNRSDVYGMDVYLKYRPTTRQSDTTVALQAEWFQRRRQVPRDLLADSGGYAYLTWRFDKRWATAVRWELGLPAENRAGDTGGDYLDPAWTASRQRVSANLTYWPTEYSRLRAQGSLDAPGWRDEPIYALMLACEFTIGAHGAHAF